MGDAAQELRHQRRKQSCPETRLQHTAAAPAKALQSGPDCPDDELRREMRILGAARERGIVGPADSFLKRRAYLLPPNTEFDLARSTEDAVGKIGCTEADETDQPLLLVSRGRALVAFNF